MVEFLLNSWFWYKILWLISLVLLFLRDDIQSIKFEFKITMEFHKIVGVLHLLVIVLALPVTLPFTLSNIINRWF